MSGQDETPFSVPEDVFAQYVRGTDTFPPDEQERADIALSAATNLCLRYLGPRGRARIPDSDLTQAILDTAADLYKRRDSAGGLRQISESEAVKIGRDPQWLARPILDAYRGQKVR